LQPASGVDNHDAVAGTLGLLDAGLGDVDDVLRGAVGVHGDIELLAEGLELVDGGRAVDVAGDETRRPILALELPGKLGRGGRLPRALEADHHDDGGRDRAELESLAPLAEHGGELVVDDLDELLTGRDGAELGDTDGLLLDTLEELARQLEVD